MEIGLGCVNLGSASNGQSVRSQTRLIHEAVDLGVAVFDTAAAYGRGASERVLGRALQGRRAQAVIATKVGYPFAELSPAAWRSRRLAGRGFRLAGRAQSLVGSGREAGHRGGRGSYATQDFRPAALRQQLDGSLRRLGTDHVDVLQLHGPHHYVSGLFAELADLLDAGKVRRFGVGAESVADAEAWIGDRQLDVLQVPFGILDPDGARVLGQARHRGVDGWARGVLGAGLLRDDAAPDPHHAQAALVRRLRTIATDAGMGLVDLALGFVRAAGVVDTVIVGMSSSDHLRTMIGSMGGAPLDADVLTEARAAVEGHRANGAPR